MYFTWAPFMQVEIQRHSNSLTSQAYSQVLEQRKTVLLFEIASGFSVAHLVDHKGPPQRSHGMPKWPRCAGGTWKVNKSGNYWALSRNSVQWWVVFHPCCWRSFYRILTQLLQDASKHTAFCSPLVNDSKQTPRDANPVHGRSADRCPPVR